MMPSGENTKRTEKREAIRFRPDLAKRFKAARDRHQTSTPNLLARLLDYFDGLTINQQAAIVRGETDLGGVE